MLACDATPRQTHPPPLTAAAGMLLSCRSIKQDAILQIYVFCVSLRRSCAHYLECRYVTQLHQLTRIPAGPQMSFYTIPAHMNTLAPMKSILSFAVPRCHLSRSMPQVQVCASKGFGSPRRSAKKKKGKRKAEYSNNKSTCPCGSGQKYSVRQSDLVCPSSPQAWHGL